MAPLHDLTPPRPEHPRPQLERDAWLNLNGTWNFAFDPRTIGEQERWYIPDPARSNKMLAGNRPQQKNLTINVPFPWESTLSGLARTDYKGAGWYEREITIPEDWDNLAPYLNFEAVDWQARIWINGRFAIENENGYLPFSVDLRPYLRLGESTTITVRAYDVADSATLVGKQVSRWYTHSSGIWQTVWLEGRAPSHVRNIRVEPDIINERATVQLTMLIAAAGTYIVRLQSPDDAFPTVEQEHQFDVDVQELTLTFAVPSPELWSPDNPYLYDLVVELVPGDGGISDRVRSYFGMRSISRGSWNSNELEYILLNGEPLYLSGALDQAFFPDGLHTYPTDASIRSDIQLAKDLGLNMLRCHIKINEPRYYYWADRLGLLIMYDLPSPDLDTPSMRALFEQTLRNTLRRDFNSPSIFAWVLFNETWGLTNHDTAEGQAWLQQMYRLAKELDPTRLIEDNSPCRYDHVETDINSWHFYINDYWRARQHVQRVVDETFPGSSFNYVGGKYVQQNAPLMNSEYGGIGALSGDQDISWCFKYLTTDLRRHHQICGYVYTELADIEWEHNGFVNYDRSQKEFGYDFFVADMQVADLNCPDLVGFDVAPCQTLSPGSRFCAPLFVSHWGLPMSTGQIRWQLDFIDRFGARQVVDDGEIVITPQRYAVTELGDLDIPLPNENGLATIALRLEDDSGRIRCRNYVNVEVRGDRGADIEERANDIVLRIAPEQFARTTWVWPPPYTDGHGGKFAAMGSGWVEYELVLPETLDARSVREMHFVFEAAARAGGAKVDWTQRTCGTNYPQTEVDKKFPSDLTISINDVVIGQVELPDDPADARGVLSHHRSIDPGSYGYLTELAIEQRSVAQIFESQSTLRIRFSVLETAQHRGGLVLYGETLGCYPVAPTLILRI